MDIDLEVETAAMCRLEPINKVMCRGDSEIQKFYDNAVVLMTGGTGFLGKHLIEKLLRCCNIKKLYLLVRQKNNKTKEMRLADILDDVLFEDLYKKKPNFASSIETVHGDISEIGLGMSEGDRQAVTAEVRGRGFYESFVHVSTAYSHATYSRNGKEVLDDFYPSPISPTALIDMAETVDVNVMNNIAPSLIEGWPNTYAFTKAVTEELLRTTADGLPACIVRPSIILNAYTEPRPGWVCKESLNGPLGLGHAIKMGFQHQMFLNSEIRLDCIPVDYVTNVTIAAGWETTTRHAAGHHDVKIYPVVSTKNRLKWGEVSDVLYQNENGVSSQAMWYAFAINVGNIHLYTVLHWLLHLVPAYLADGVGMLLGRKPTFIKLYTKIHKLMEVLHYFTTREWFFCDVNTLALYQKMSPEDQTIFNFDMLSIDWREMMRLLPIGLRRFILKDGLKNSEYARKKQFWFKMVTYLLFGVYMFILLFFLFSCFKYVF